MRVRTRSGKANHNVGINKAYLGASCAHPCTNCSFKINGVILIPLASNQRVGSSNLSERTIKSQNLRGPTDQVAGVADADSALTSEVCIIIHMSEFLCSRCRPD